MPANDEYLVYAVTTLYFTHFATCILFL